MFTCSRLPLTNGLAPLWPGTLVNPAGFTVIVPGSRRASWLALRPLSGSVVAVLPEMTSPTVTVSVCRIGAAASTWMVSSRVPTSIRRSRRATCLASSVNSGVAAVRNPLSSAFTV